MAAGQPNPSSVPWIAVVVFLGFPALLIGSSWLLCGDATLIFLAVFTGYLVYGIAYHVGMMLLSISGLGRAKRASAGRPEVAEAITVTVAIPAHNEEATIVSCVQSLLGQSHGNLDVVVVDDGSTDETWARLTERYRLVPEGGEDGATPAPTEIRPYRSAVDARLRVVGQARAGKAAALNAALAAARGEILITGDADTVFTRHAVGRMAAYMNADPDVVAAGGVVIAGNGAITPQLMSERHARLPRGLLTKLQWIEYATNYVLRFGWARLNILLLLSGSFSAFRIDLIRAVGGFDPQSVTEDYEMAYRLHVHCARRGRPYRLITVPDPLAYTLVPETLWSLIQQRTRWFHGFLQTLVKYRREAFRSRYGWFGVFALPVKWVDAVMPFWGAYIYAAIALNVATGTFHVPVAVCLFVGLLFVRYTVDVAMNWTQLYLRQRHVAPALRGSDNLLLFLLTPVNVAFQRMIWLIYGLKAHYRLMLQVSRWEKARRGRFDPVTARRGD